MSHLAYSLWRIVEDLLLVGQAEGAVERQDDPLVVQLGILPTRVNNLNTGIYSKNQKDVEPDQY